MLGNALRWLLRWRPVLFSRGDATFVTEIQEGVFLSRE